MKKVKKGPSYVRFTSHWGNFLFFLFSVSLSVKWKLSLCCGQNKTLEEIIFRFLFIYLSVCLFGFFWFWFLVLVFFYWLTSSSISKILGTQLFPLSQQSADCCSFSCRSSKVASVEGTSCCKNFITFFTLCIQLSFLISLQFLSLSDLAFFPFVYIVYQARPLLHHLTSLQCWVKCGRKAPMLHHFHGYMYMWICICACQVVSSLNNPNQIPLGPCPLTHTRTHRALPAALFL